MPYDKETLGQILLYDDCRTIDNNGKLYPPTNPVYSVIAEKMELRDSHITARHVYTILNENRNGFRELVQKTYGCKPTEPAQTKYIYDSTTDISTCSINTDRNETNDRLSSKNIRLVLSAKNWQEISPKKKVSSGRVYWKFKEGWTDILAERLCQQHSTLDCVFSFKNNIVTPTPTARYYALFTGICIECGSKITGTLLSSPANDVDVIFICHIQNIKTAKHSGTKKRQLRGQRRIKVCKKMIEEKKDAVTFRREEARRLKKFGGNNVAIIPNATVLRKAKEQQLLKIHGLEYANAPLNLLHHARYGQFAGFIHSISLLKFNCVYWTEEQQQLYTARTKRDGNAVMTVDATGGIEKRSHKEDPHVFLYQCMLVTSEGSVPVFQMVSADQRSLIIAQFFRYILSKGAPRPSIVVCDFGRAIINAVAEIFALCRDLQDYLQRCYGIIYKQPKVLPATFIRLDVSHLISMVSRWGCLKNKVVAARRFYLRCIAQAYQTSDFESLSCIIKSILAVALSEYVGIEPNREVVPAQVCMETLTKIIEGVPASVQTDYDDEASSDSDISDATDDSDNDDCNTESAANWKSWSKKIYLAAECIAEKSKGGKTINGCYNPKFAIRLMKQLLPYLPLWTGIMRTHFGRGAVIATSSSVEGEFGNLKNRVFVNKLPMRIDRFVLEHLEYLDGRVTEASNQHDLPSEKVPHLKDCCPQSNYSDVQNDISPRPRRKTDSTADSEIFINSPKKSTTVECPAVVQQTSETEVTEEKLSASLCEIASMIADTLADEAPVNILENCDLWNECEDWRGLATKRRKPTYLDKCPEWQFIKDTKISKLPIFINGNFSGPVSMGKYKLNVRKTCAFDSVFQVVMSGVATNHEYRKLVQNIANPTMQLALKVMDINKNPTSKSYFERARILSDLGLFANQQKGRRSTGQREKLDAECNAAHLAEYLFTDIPSYTRSFLCKCGRKFQSDGVMLNVNVDILLCNGFKSMQVAVDECQTKMSTCRRCGHCNKEVVRYGPHIIIDTSIVTDERYTTRNTNLRHDLDSIATTICLQDRTYVLAGIVNWTPGHYFAYVKCGLYWHEYNDIGPVRKCVSPKTQIAPHVIFYTCTAN